MSHEVSQVSSSVAGNAASRENRVRQMLAEAERRAQTLRNNPSVRPAAETEEVVRTDLVNPVVPVAETVIGIETPALLQNGSGTVDASLLPPGEALAHLSCVLGVLGELLQDDGSGVDADPEQGDEIIAGSGDRVPALALKTASIVYPPLPLRYQPARLPALRPAARGECERRCNQGAPGFCDPSSELGCGGQFCGAHQQLLRDLSATAPATHTTAAESARSDDTPAPTGNACNDID